MLLNDVVNYNHSIEKTNVNNVNDFKELIKKIDKRKNSIQRGIIEIQERAKYRQDIRDNIIKDIDHLDYIENLKDYSFNDNMRISIELPYSLMLDFHKSIELKYGCNDPMSKNVITLISKFNESFLGERQQHVTSSFLKYNGKEPRLDVLLKLKRIADLLYEYNFDGFVRPRTVKQAIEEELNADKRTADNYFITIRDFVEKMMDEKTRQYRDWNLMGLREAIYEKLRVRDSKQDNTSEENV
ncbi:MAG: hypothetical protein HOD60_06475 [Candidatus Nitrosopelagicus sp.]|jgi:hypothetical protein|nr:hypothetical protein [Candidatus Nitrosopelagicus sp.]